MDTNTKRSGLSLLEVLIVVSVIIIIALAFLILIDPLTQFNRGHDNKRTHEIGQLSKLLDDYYNDWGKYPDDNAICYGNATNYNNTCSCYICGNENTSPDFTPYMNTLPCDPHQPNKRYLYQYECSLKSWYRIYVALSDSSVSYNFAATSPNTTAESPYPTIAPPPSRAPLPTDEPLYCAFPIFCMKSGGCDTCKNIDGIGDCISPNCDHPVTLYFDNSCKLSCIEQ